MTDPQHKPRVADDDASEPTEEPRTQAAALAPARLLANPRRVRRA
jgi:hypothetical protein